MNIHPRRVLRFARCTSIRHWIVALILLASALSGCGAQPRATPRVERAKAPTQSPQPTAVPTAASAAEVGKLRLEWWTPEFLSTQAPQPSGEILAKQLRMFSEAQGGDVEVETVRKARYGKGGLLDSLRTAQPVAKDVLPDIIALDTAEVEKAVEAGLLQPLNTLIDPAVTEKLYPFATEAGLFNEQSYAVQYLADVDHAAYLPAQLSKPLASWAELIEHRIAYLFPMAQLQTGSSAGSSARPAESLSHAVLSQYLSAGATLATDRRLLLEPQPLLRLLSFYADGKKADILPSAEQELTDDDTVWRLFSQGRAPLAYTTARHFMARGETPAEFAAAPGFQAEAPRLASGWALAIVTQVPRRQRAAAELITWLLKPENAGAWAASASWLPTSTEALKAMGSERYWTFLDYELAQARSLPVGTEYRSTASKIQAAIEAVVGGQSSPAAAVEAATSGP